MLLLFAALGKAVHDEDVLSGVLVFTKFLQEEKVNLYRGGVGYS